jgi:hypothetical protein
MYDLLRQEKELVIAVPSNDLGQGHEGGITPYTFYPVVKRAFIPQRNSDPLLLFKVMKFGREKFIGANFKEDSPSFTETWKRQVDFQPEFLFGSSQDMQALFPYVYVLEYKRRKPVHQVSFEASDNSKYFAVTDATHKDVMINFTQEGLGRAENKINFLIGKMDRERNKIEYARMQSSVDKKDSVLVGTGDFIVIIDSQNKQRLNLSSLFVTRIPVRRVRQNERAQLPHPRVALRSRDMERLPLAISSTFPAEKCRPGCCTEQSSHNVQVRVRKHGRVCLPNQTRRDCQSGNRLPRPLRQSPLRQQL